jgi:hypothetical protein
MTPATFNAQMKRLTTRFGLKALDQEFCSLVWRACSEMSDGGFITFCDVLIGSRKHTDPPRLQEFRDAVLAEQKRKFESDLKACDHVVHRKPMPEILTRLGYPSCKTLWDAVEVEREIIRMQRQVEAADKGGA